MQAYVVEAHGAAPKLTERPVPLPGPGEVRLRVLACGLNFADLLMIKGTYQDTPPLPFVPGLEVCGIVEQLGPGVTGPDIGTRVAVVTGSGGLAEFCCAPADRCVPVPDAMPAEVAAGFQIAYGTSHVALTHKARLRPGERLVVLGAAGGVGLTAVELGTHLGAEVVAVARGPEKLGLAQTAGAHHAIDADAPDIRDQVKALGGADVVYDAVGGDLFQAAFRAMRPDGRIIVVGFASGQVPQIKANHLLVKNVDVLGLYWGGYMATKPQVVTQSMADLLAMYQAGDLKPHISHVLPLAHVDEALDLIRSRQSTGKVVVTP